MHDQGVRELKADLTKTPTKTRAALAHVFKQRSNVSIKGQGYVNRRKQQKYATKESSSPILAIGYVMLSCVHDAK